MSLSLIPLIKSAGYIGVWGTIFAETGLLFGIFLPGDMLLFAVGVLAAQGYFDLTTVVSGCFIAAVAGNILGYEIGSRLGLPFLQKYSKRYATPEHIEKTQAFFNRYGRSSVILARFIPVARTLAPFLAGIARMDYQVYVAYSFIGGALWAAGLPIAGYYLAGHLSPALVDYILLPIVFIVIIFIVLMGKYRRKDG